MIRYYKGDYKYVLAEDLTYNTGILNKGFALQCCSINCSGWLFVTQGYAWDGPSGPTFATKSTLRGSLVHDALYQLLRETGFGKNGNGDTHDLRRYRADQILRNICVEDRMWEWRADWWFRGVRAGGGPSAAVKERRVYQAP